MLLLVVTSCGESSRSGSPDVVTRLCQHIVQKRQKLIVDTNRTEIVWSDGAILELGTNFPGGLQELISKPTHFHDIRSFVTQLEIDDATKWKEATASPSSKGKSYTTIKSLDGKVSTVVESLYIEYLRQRYPAFAIRVKGEFEPVAFLVDGQIRASVMPVKF